jgi:hypothetical protein
MKLNPEHYRYAMSSVKYFDDKYKDVEFEKLSSTIAVSLNVPIYVIALYLEEVRGQTEETQRVIKEIKDFYRYEE